MIPIFLALDTPSENVARRLLQKCGSAVEVKFGLEFFIANGPIICDEMRDAGSTGSNHRQVFLDLKLYDIPATVAAAVRGTWSVAPDYISVHCAGLAQLQAAKLAADDVARGGKRPKILGVTVLTSEPATPEQVLRLADLAYTAGIDGLICSPHEIAMLRTKFGPGSATYWEDLFLMVPGIRSAGVTHHDQQRVATPREAMDAGASALVIGREISGADDPAAAIAAIQATLA